MRILHILNHVREIGNGIVNVAVDLACLQAKLNHQVVVASAGGEYETLLSRYGVQHFTLDQTRNPINLLQAFKKSFRFIQEFKPDIVHTHMMTGVVLARVVRAIARKYCLISTVHNEFQRSAILMGFADRVIAVSKAVAKSMNRRGIPQHKLRVVCNGTLGSPRTRPLTDYAPLPLKRPAITTVAGMYRRKGIAELIEAFGQIARDFPQANLYIVGDGPDRSEFEAQAQTTAVADRINFTGFQSQPQKYLLATDIFVLASHQDPSPLVIPEAREAKCAIVASSVDGIPEALDCGQAGILVPPKDSQALATALSQLLSDRHGLEEWKAKTQKNLEWLTLDRVYRNTLSVYQEAIIDCHATNSKHHCC